MSDVQPGHLLDEKFNCSAVQSGVHHACGVEIFHMSAVTSKEVNVFTVTKTCIKLASGTPGLLLAFARIELDGCLIIHDMKIIQGKKGRFVKMPDHKVRKRCVHCTLKNPIDANFCYRCRTEFSEESKAVPVKNGRRKDFDDIVHPITHECTEYLRDTVLAAYETELEKSRQSGYRCTYEGFRNVGEHDSDEADTLASVHP